MKNERVTNLTSLREICGGEKHFIIEIIDAFVSKAMSDVADIENAYISNDKELLKKKAHRYKSSVQFFELNGIYKLLSEIEKDGLANNTEEEKGNILKEIRDVTAQACSELIEERKVIEEKQV